MYLCNKNYLNFNETNPFLDDYALGYCLSRRPAHDH